LYSTDKFEPYSQVEPWLRRL